MWRAFFVLTLAGGMSLTAQNVTLSTVKATGVGPTNAPAITAAKIPAKKLEPTPVKLINPEHYGGLITELASTNKPLNVLNLNAPLDPVADKANLATNPVTGRPIGVNLFSFKF